MDELRTLVRRLPVLPVCAAEVIRAARDGNISADRLVYLANQDQVLAGNLIQSANSAAYTWAGRVGNVEQSVLYLGEMRASQLLLSVALKPILGVTGHQALWEHSLEVAHVSHRVAADTHSMHSPDAYILGLLHDVGQLLLHMFPFETRGRVSMLIDSGATRDIAETSVFGLTHAEAGAYVLRFWKMPEDYVEAVLHHHHPEAGGGAGAAMLYMAEQWTDPAGDELETARLDCALNTLKLSDSYRAQLGGRGFA
jgi:putative nucleotidyltransferase with HDIG domain